MINIKLGIIYYIDELPLHNKLDYIDYIKINNVEEINLTNKPTLIVGWNLAKEKFPKINILNKTINTLYYWTFSFSEKNNLYVNDINKFCNTDILNIFKFYNYNVLSPIFNNELTNIDNYIDFFKDCKLNNIFLSKNIQLTVLCNNEIFRINLKELNYFKIEVKPLLNYLKENYNTFIYDKNGKIEEEYKKYFKNLDDTIVSKYIPLFNKVINS